jgi:hypothetical protein
MSNKPTSELHQESEAGSLNKSSCLAPVLGVTIVTDMILVTLVVLLKSHLDVQQTHL